MLLRSRRLNSLIAFAAICSMLLSAAMPMLARAAAEMQGVPIAEVCEVYGVALPQSAQADPHAHHHHHMHTGHDAAGAHGSDHCALLALAAIAPPGMLPMLATHDGVDFFFDLPPAPGPVFDATAQWFSRLKHGPPPRA